MKNQIENIATYSNDIYQLVRDSSLATTIVLHFQAASADHVRSALRGVVHGIAAKTR